MSLIREARQRAGFSLEGAAQSVRVSAAYLARIERTGLCSLPCARRLGRLYGVSIDLFIITIGQNRQATTAGRTAIKRVKKNALIPVAIGIGRL